MRTSFDFGQNYNKSLLFYKLKSYLWNTVEYVGMKWYDWELAYLADSSGEWESAWLAGLAYLMCWFVCGFA